MHRTHAAAVKLLTHALVLRASGVVPQAERSNRNRIQHSNCNQQGVQQCQPVRKDRPLALRKVDHLLGLQSCVPPGCKGTPPHQQVLAAAAASELPLFALPLSLSARAAPALLRWQSVQHFQSALTLLPVLVRADVRGRM